MTKDQEKEYCEPELLRDILIRVLSGMKVRLDCGHHATLLHPLGNDITTIISRGSQQPLGPVCVPLIQDRRPRREDSLLEVCSRFFLTRNS
jgi:hypothetical protein